MSGIKLNHIQYDIFQTQFDSAQGGGEPRLSGLPYVHIFNFLALEDLFSLRLVRKMTAEESLYFSSVLIARMRLNLRMPRQLESYVQSQFFGKLRAIHLTHQICLYQDFNEFSKFLNGVDLKVMQAIFGSVRHLNLKKAYLAAETLTRILSSTKQLEVLKLEDARCISDALMAMDDETLRGCVTPIKNVSFCGSNVTGEALQRFLLATTQLRALSLLCCKLISPMIEGMEQEDLNRIFASVEKLNLGFTDITDLALQKLLLACQNLQSLSLWHCQALPIAIQSLTQEQLTRRMFHIIDLDLSLINMTADALDTLLRTCRSLTKLALDGNMANIVEVLERYDDHQVREIFATMERLDLNGVPFTLNSLRRLLLSCHSLKVLSLMNCVYISEVIKSFSDAQLHQVFGSVEELYLSGTKIKSFALYKILLACQPLKVLRLAQCTNISRALSYATQAQMRRFFGQIETLDLSETSISRFQLKRLFLSLKDIKNLYLNACLNLISVLDELSLTQLEAIFYYLDDFKCEKMTIPKPILEKWMLSTKRYRKFYN